MSAKIDTFTGGEIRRAFLSRAEEPGAARLLRAYAVFGLFSMLVPGTLVGVLNLITIGGQHAAGAVAPEWVQAHGHAQIFGWIGTFIVGIGYYSLPRSRRASVVGIDEGWVALALWGAGVLLRWSLGISASGWRVLLPTSAGLELAGFLIFFRASSGHRPEASDRKGLEAWALLVIAATGGMLLALAANFAVALWMAFEGRGPAVPHDVNQKLLGLTLWGFLVPFVWGFTARWAPALVGVEARAGATVLLAYGLSVPGVLALVVGSPVTGATLLLAASVAVAVALGVFSRARRQAVTEGVHPCLPAFVRAAYAWSLAGAALALWGAVAGDAAGVVGASRHALTVGFLSTMVFSVGPRILPLFTGTPGVFSPGLVVGSLTLLNFGCVLRVVSQIVAYQGYADWAWDWLPISAVVELTAVSLFAANLGLTFAFGARGNRRASGTRGVTSVTDDARRAGIS
jgi:uncharacterized protein involved in response to NO